MHALPPGTWGAYEAKEMGFHSKCEGSFKEGVTWPDLSFEVILDAGGRTDNQEVILEAVFQWGVGTHRGVTWDG